MAGSSVDCDCTGNKGQRLVYGVGNARRANEATAIAIPLGPLRDRGVLSNFLEEPGSEPDCACP